MPSPVSILDFIHYCGGLEKFLDLMETINRDEMPVYEVAELPRFGLNPAHISRFLSAHFRREYVPTDDTRLILEHEIQLAENKLDERRRNLTREGSAPILSLSHSGGSRPR